MAIPCRSFLGQFQRSVLASLPCYAIAMLLLAAPVASLLMVLEGDASADLFVNGIFVLEDGAAPVVPLNSLQRVITGSANSRVMTSTYSIQDGDLIALRVVASVQEMRNVTDALGRVTVYPAYAGVILAGEDGIMTTSGWKCSLQKETNDVVKIPFFSTLFDDSHWDYAFEQPDDCCPWRDPLDTWRHMGAKWIGMSPATFGGNLSGPRTYNCRYTVHGNTTSERLPPEQTELADTGDPEEASPKLNITSVIVATSMSKVTVIVDRPANIYCGMIDARYQLRTPTHNELKSWGAAKKDAMGPYPAMEFVGGHEFFNEELDYPTARSLKVSGMDRCEIACLTEDEFYCAAFVFVAVGASADGSNCKLIDGTNITIDETNMKPISRSALFQQKKVVIKDSIHELTMSGMLLPGTIYNTFCSAEDNATGVHVNFTTIGETVEVVRTAGCFDCGSTNPPQVEVLGGWSMQEKIGIVAKATRAGRIFCNAFENHYGNLTIVLTSNSIRAPEFFNILTVAGDTVGVAITGLKPATRYEVACIAEADGGLESAQEWIEGSRRVIYTEDTEVTINSMKIIREADVGRDRDKDRMEVSLQLTRFGYMWCMVLEFSEIREEGVPRAKQLRADGQLGKITDLQQPFGAVYGGLVRNSTYDLWCTAEYNDFKNETLGDSVSSPYPITSIISHEVRVDSVAMLLRINKGPASIFCDAFQWALRPTTERPEPPPQSRMSVARFHTELFNIIGGAVELTITGLVSGMYYDIYCYSETWQPPVPPGVVAPPRLGMDFSEIQSTRTKVLMKGPLFDETGWGCVAGHPCELKNVLGVGLTDRDKVLVRTDACPRRCSCLGITDPNLKGATCSAISQDEEVVSGVGVNDKKDPRGPWCYVERGACEDEVESELFDDYWLSYVVCSYNATVGKHSTRGPEGFPNGGLAITRKDSGGTIFDISLEPMVAVGRPYQLCWCNGTETSCERESDFKLNLGLLHFSGPSAAQRQRNMTCRVGLPCVLEYFEGHALEEGSRMVVLPEDPRGCSWSRSTIADPPGIDGFPNFGVSEVFDVIDSSFSFFSVPLVIPGGTYNLCWCGPPVRGMVKAPGKEYRIPDGLTPPPCPDFRSDDAGNFTAPAGKLVVIGPVQQEMAFCKLGIECVLPAVQGTGLSGSDRISALEHCGKAAHPPLGWDAGVKDLNGLSGNSLSGWVARGWMTDGPQLGGDMLDSFGVTQIQGEASRNESNATPLNASDRGVYGFPNMGMTLPNAIPGYYSWGGPTWAFAGTYVLCWCGADATTDGCKSPADFLVPVGKLTITGPLILPLAAQVHRCVRERPCEIANFQGTTPPSSKLYITTECGTEAPNGIPQRGQSLNSQDGVIYSWGGDPIMVTPGMYKLCWCSDIFSCNTFADFQSYSGIMQVKAPIDSPLEWFCPLGAPCNISGISGEGLTNNDKIMAMINCGAGSSPDEGFDEGGLSLATFGGGTTYTLPRSRMAGVYQICWCAGEQMCRNSWDFDVSLGRLDVGGPKGDVVYRCWQWLSCEIEELDGLALSDGDLLKVVPEGTRCDQYSNPPAQAGFPNGAVSLPATGGGKRFSWGTDLVMASAGRYALCWCGNHTLEGGCTERGPFSVPGGQIRIGSNKEYQFVTRPEDNPPREGDENYAYLVALPLPCLMCGAIILGVRRLKAAFGQREEPEAPSLRTARVLSDNQQKAKATFEVGEVADTRSRITIQMEAHAEKIKSGLEEDVRVLSLYGMLQKQTKISKMEDEERESREAERKASRYNRRLRGEEVSDSDESIEEVHEDEDQKQKTKEEVDFEAWLERKRKRGREEPEPPSVSWNSIHNQRLLHTVGFDGDPRTLVAFELS
eukprot:TRINITY_DN20592_c0_g1_i2.p1 TRINITY_DN20592_c0_g1~~TRINITY_DN20592_c0_g1_i2.p1  ORF type:complete len:1891 (-),score=352.02 TRINITY_DN20592_c0_g1_i2:78-5615(-)